MEAASLGSCGALFGLPLDVQGGDLNLG